jgi:excisionase family DNA binding protein
LIDMCDFGKHKSLISKGTRMADQTVTTGEAAQRLGVAPATIQRWVNAGLVIAERTMGGHRRIPIAEVRRLLASSRPTSLTGSAAGFLDVLLSGRPNEIKAALFAIRQRTGSWAASADEVASAISELGRKWEAGSCSVFQEHEASEKLRRATAGCVEHTDVGAKAERAALFTVVGERHTLGLSLAELVLAEAGTGAIWFGEGPPTEELDDLVEKTKPGILVVSASSVSSRNSVSTYQKALTKIAKLKRIPLVLGGSGPWTRHRLANRAETFCDLRDILERLDSHPLKKARR